MRLLIVLVMNLVLSLCYDIENGVVDKPSVRCGANNIQVTINTERVFRGRLYVQGEAGNRKCIKLGKDEETNVMKFELPIGACNMRRQRTIHPRGVSFSFTLIVSFHPLFLTGMDRAFHIRCFFLESIRSLEAGFDVGRLKTELVEQDFQLPDCTYQLQDNPAGTAIQYAQVGQRVTHRWSCVDGSNHIYGLLIHSCFADDGQDSKFELIDDRGCSTDTFLLPQIKYDSNKLTASTEGEVFKYADKVQLFFTCTIQLCYKHDGGCEGITPPVCEHEDFHDRHHVQHIPKHAPPKELPFKIPPFPHNIPRGHMPRGGHDESDSGANKERHDGPGMGTRRVSFSGSQSRERPFFRSFERPMDFKSHPYRDSPLNETDSSDIVLDGNSTAAADINEKAKKKRRDLTMETDLSVDVIVLPFEKTKSGRPRLSPSHVCMSRSAFVVFSSAALVTLALGVIVTVIIVRRKPSYNESMDAFK